MRTSLKQLFPESPLVVDEERSLRHLLANLACLDVRMRREVRRWQLAGQDPTDAFRGLYISDDQANGLLNRPMATSWGQTLRLEAAEEESFQEALTEKKRAVEQISQEARLAGRAMGLEQLARVFQLDTFAQDVLLICLAPMLDLRYERLYGYLQDDVTRKRPTVNLALDLLCQPGTQRLHALAHFADDAPLFRYRLLERLHEPGTARPTPLNQALTVDETILSWLLGSYRPALELGSSSSLTQPANDTVDQLIAGDILTQIPAVAPALLVFHGPELEGQAAAARLYAIHLNRPLLTVDLFAPVLTDGESPSMPQRMRIILRDAKMTGAVLFLQGWDVCLEDGAPPASLMEEMDQHPGPIILSGRALWQAPETAGSRPLFWIDFPLPDYAQRTVLWSHCLDQVAAADERNLQGREVITDLAARFNLSTAQIRAAAAAARDQAVQRGTPLSKDDLFRAARAVSSPRLDSQARKIIPRFGWTDIVLPDDRLEILKELVAAVRGRPIVLDAWGAGKKLVSSTGITALFAGPPGVGKTMAAEVIASELGLDLYKIDLSSVVSKYIGETEKNLEAIFGEAASSSAILFFDEADALFGKRSEVRDAHDRYANVEISYLLQRMETYEGVTILATNLRANLDEAFTRRMQFAVDFPFPSEEDRLRIWQSLFPHNMPRAAELDFTELAGRYKLSGGGIRNAILSAAYLAAANGGVVTMEHLLHGTRRELQKMGKMIEAQS